MSTWEQEAFLHISQQCWQIERKLDIFLDRFGITNLDELQIEKVDTDLHRHVASLKAALDTAQKTPPPEQTQQ